jgi:hypothetical protein
MMSLIGNSLLLSIFSNFKFFIYLRGAYTSFSLLIIFIRWRIPYLIVEKPSYIIMFSRILEGFGNFFFVSK